MNNYEEDYQLNYKIVFLFLGVIIVFSAASLAMSIIWKQQGISVVALEVKKLEIKINDLQRTNTYLQTNFARKHTPENLIANTDVAFAAPAKSQVVWLNYDKRNKDIEPYVSSAVAVTANLPSRKKQ